MIADRVAAGAAWLDEHHPGWVDRIDLDRLNLADRKACVLGQMFGDFNAAPSELLEAYETDDEVVHGNRSVALGFDLITTFELDRSPGHSLLTELWRDLIIARRAEADAR